MSANASFLAALIPMIIYLIIIWRMDKYDREPIRFVLIHFFWGAFGAILFGFLGSAILGNFTGITEDNNPANSLIQTIIFAPLSEEIAKGVFLIWSVRSKEFDNITDGLVYGGAIGLGFGMTENFTYFISYGNTFSSWIYLVFVRSFFSAVMHMISTATFGATLGMAKFSLKITKHFLPIAGLILAIIFHFLWNFTVSFQSTYWFGFIFIVGLIIYFFLIFKFATNKEKKIIESELDEESEILNFPKEHVKIISSSLRFRKGWVDEKIRKQYFRAAIKLAFRKIQSKNSEGYSKVVSDYEVEMLRSLIRDFFPLDTVGNS